MVNINRMDPGCQKKIANAAEAAETTQAAPQTTGESAAVQTTKQDSFSRTVQAETAEDAGVIYKPNTALVEQLKAEHQQVMDRFTNMIREMLGKQGKTIAVGQGYWKFMASSQVTVEGSIQGTAQEGGESVYFSATQSVRQELTVEIKGFWSVMASGAYEVDPETQAAAQAAIAEDGYWGVEQTAQRIVGFGRALTGGDPGMIDLLREAFLKGMDAAREAWGGDLPEITDRTKERVLELFGLWAKEGQEVTEGPVETEGEQVEAPVEGEETVETPAEPEEEVPVQDTDRGGKTCVREDDERNDRDDYRHHDKHKRDHR